MILPSPLPADSPFLSPALSRSHSQGGPAFEMKFLISDEQARRLTDWVQTRWQPDPHGDPELEGAYHTTTLYCDTPGLTMFRRVPGYANRKFRLRRYGNESRIYLERKTKWGERVHKRRSSILEVELPRFNDTEIFLGWPGLWFRRRLHHHGLTPACQISYERLAFMKSGIRLTMDRRLRCASARSWALQSGEEGLPILAGRVILEFKYAARLPVPCKELIELFNLTPSRVSKYRQGMEAWGHRALAGEVG